MPGKATPKVLLLIAALAMAGGCAGRETVISVTPLDSFVWTGDAALLTYGAPGAGAPILAFHCREGDGPAIRYRTGNDEKRRSDLQIAAAGRQILLPASVGQVDEAAVAVARPADLSPALDILTAGGEAQVWAAGVGATLTERGLADAAAAFRAGCAAAR